MIPVPQGYLFAAVAAGFKKADKLDLGVICSDRPAVTAGVYTKNRFQAAPVLVCRERLDAVPSARAFLVNSGQANACTGDEGLVNARVTMEMVAEVLGVGTDEVLPASTGVIGAQLRLDRWKAAMPALKENLGKAAVTDAAKAIMTTDTFPKLAWGEVETGNGTIRVAGMAKGAGMISPNMATMLGFVICDAEVDPQWWRETLAWCADRSFNCVTVDGDTSTNDTLMAMANGASGVNVDAQHAREPLREVLLDVCQALAYMIVQDAEGGTKVCRISVAGAKDDAQAELAARAVGHSPLVKTALFGEDPNWGRIVAAVGRSGADFEPGELRLFLGSVLVFADGQPASGDLDAVLVPLMRKQDIDVSISLGDGPGEYTLLASDLSREYVSINADYRS